MVASKLSDLYFMSIKKQILLKFTKFAVRIK